MFCRYHLVTMLINCIKDCIIVDSQEGMVYSDPPVTEKEEKKGKRGSDKSESFSVNIIMNAGVNEI